MHGAVFDIATLAFEPNEAQYRKNKIIFGTAYYGTDCRSHSQKTNSDNSFFNIFLSYSQLMPSIPKYCLHS